MSLKYRGNTQNFSTARRKTAENSPLTKTSPTANQLKWITSSSLVSIVGIGALGYKALEQMTLDEFRSKFLEAAMFFYHSMAGVRPNNHPLIIVAKFIKIATDIYSWVVKAKKGMQWGIEKWKPLLSSLVSDVKIN